MGRTMATRPTWTYAVRLTSVAALGEMDRRRGNQRLEEGLDLETFLGESSKNLCAEAAPWPPCKATACSRVCARPSWRYGAESRKPQSGGVRHSCLLAPRRDWPRRGFGR